MSTDADFPAEFPIWLSTRRWYAGKGSTPQLERIGGWKLERAGVVITTHYMLDHLGDRTALYQVPLTTRTTPLSGVDAIGVISDEQGDRYVYEGTLDPAYPAALLELILSEGTLPGETTDDKNADGTPDAGADSALATNAIAGHRQPGAPEVEVLSAKVLSGEQSNTSIICQVAAGRPVIIKVFRALHHGENPDVTLQSAIAATGSLLVPTSLGYLAGAWSDTGRPNGRAVGHLAFAQEFLPGVEDAWRVALDAARSGTDFADRARALGAATADVHAILAETMPVRQPSLSDVTDILFSMRSRLALAMTEVPDLEEWRGDVEKIFDRAHDATWPTLQRIHGDFHLGQVLSVPDRGWVLLDFEGEPLRPMSERSNLDVTLRDIAGMLRSFDYAAGSAAGHAEAGAAEDWALGSRQAFIDGYAEHSAIDPRSDVALLDAFEIDKALYEAVYEARNRPEWLSLPVGAIRRLAEGFRARTA